MQLALKNHKYTNGSTKGQRESGKTPDSTPPKRKETAAVINGKDCTQINVGNVNHENILTNLYRSTGYPASSQPSCPKQPEPPSQAATTERRWTRVHHSKTRRLQSQQLPPASSKINTANGIIPQPLTHIGHKHHNARTPDNTQSNALLPLTPHSFQRSDRTHAAGQFARTQIFDFHARNRLIEFYPRDAKTGGFQ